LRTIKAIPVHPEGCTIEPGCKTRDWFLNHTYKCLPVTTANAFGWDVVLSDTLEFEWDGGDRPENLKLHKGDKIAESHFGMGTLTITLRHMFETPEGVHLMVMPIPNADDVVLEPMTAIVETDWIDYPFWVTCRVAKTGKHVVPAGTRIARIMPMSLGVMGGLRICEAGEPVEQYKERYALAQRRTNEKGVWTKKYQKQMVYKGLRTPALEADPNENMEEFAARYGVLIIQNFLTPEECTQVIDLWHATPEQPVADEDFWKGRIRWFDWPLPLGVKVDHDMPRLAAGFIGKGVEQTEAHAVQWPEGYAMPPHTDYGRDGEFPERDYAGIVYLNTDFEGGGIYFPEHGFAIDPEPGMLVVFPGGRTLHGVDEVRNGTRYTIASWMRCTD